MTNSPIIDCDEFEREHDALLELEAMPPRSIPSQDNDRQSRIHANWIQQHQEQQMQRIWWQG